MALSDAIKFAAGRKHETPEGRKERITHRAIRLLQSAANTGSFFIPHTSREEKNWYAQEIPRIALEFKRRTLAVYTRTPLQHFNDMAGEFSALSRLRSLLDKTDVRRTRNVFSSTANGYDADYDDNSRELIKGLRKLRFDTKQFRAYVEAKILALHPGYSQQKLNVEFRRVRRCVTYYRDQVVRTKCGAIAWANTELSSCADDRRYPIRGIDDIGIDHKVTAEVGLLSMRMFAGFEIPYARILHIDEVARAAGAPFPDGCPAYLASNGDGTRINIHVRALSQGKDKRISTVIERDAEYGFMVPPATGPQGYQRALEEFCKVTEGRGSGDLRRFVIWLASGKDRDAAMQASEDLLQYVEERCGAHLCLLQTEDSCIFDVSEKMQELQADSVDLYTPSQGYNKDNRVGPSSREVPTNNSVIEEVASLLAQDGAQDGPEPAD